MFCFHKFGKIQEDGFQYCEKCNKAEPAPCIHIFDPPIAEFNETHRTNYGNREFHVYVARCNKCGEIKRFSV